MERTIRRRSNYVWFTMFLGSHSKLAPYMGAAHKEQLTMTSKRIGLGALCIAAIATLFLVTRTLSVNAQSTRVSTQDQLHGVARTLIGPLENAVTTPDAKDVTLTGRVVDFHCFMTGQMPSSDAAKCAADCIRAGVPVGLETSQGVIVLGTGIKGPAKTLLPFAHQTVEVCGMLFENGGVKYLDVSSIQLSDETDEQNADEEN